MKKIIALALSALLLVGAAVVGTVAFLTDTDQAINVMTSGNIEIEQWEMQRQGNTLVEFKNDEMWPAFTMTPSNPWPMVENVTLGDLPGTYLMWDPTVVKNVKDKIVYVENTGRNEAYARTILAFENPTLANGDEVIEYVKMNVNGTLTDLNMTVSINGTPYALFAYTYAEAIPAKSNAAPSLLQIAFAEGATNEHMAAIKGTYDILSLTQASQTEGFDAVTAGEALDRVFGGLTEENIIKWFTGTAPTPVTDNEKLEEALTADKENIIVILENDVTYDVAAWAMDAMGGASTKTVTIYGNGHTITFNQTNSDWNNIALNNNALLTINDAHITSIGYNNGPWNRHDLNFASPVVLNNVTTDKALAFKSDATLNNVTIKDANTSDTYAIWIQPNGQTVSIDGLVVDMLDCTDGRGIKIDEQYVDAPAKVTLTVKNATFKTEEKAAILVKSAAGADIVLENVDISGVKVDPIHAVWVDEASADYADLVTVTGGKKIVEGSVNVTVISTAEELMALGGTKIKGICVLAADIDMTGKDMKPIQLTSGAENTLTFVGNNHTISNLNLVQDYQNGMYVSGLFNILHDGAALNVENLTLTNVSSNSAKYAAAVVAYNSTSLVINLNNVDVKGATVTAETVAALVSYSTGAVNMTDCDVSGLALTGEVGVPEKVGALIGTANTGTCVVTVKNCTNETAYNLAGRVINGATLVVDGAKFVATQDALNAAAASGNTVNLALAAGNYTMPEPDLRGKTLTIKGTKDTVIDVSAVDARDQFVTGANIVFEGVTLNFGKVNYMGFANTASLTYKNCTINGLQFLYCENVTFENCVLNSNGAEHCVWTYGAKNVSFTNCSFTYGDRGINCYNDNDIAGGKQTVNFTNCTFATENTASEGAVEINSCFFSVGIEVNLNGCTAPAYGKLAYVSPWDSTNGAKTTINVK